MQKGLRVECFNTADVSKFYNVEAQSQPASPRKYHINKNVSIRSNGAQPANLWNESSLSLTRGGSPKHRIPNSIRFRGQEQTNLNSRQYMTLQLRKDIKTENGVRFAKAYRPEHFVKGLGSEGPSPASYTYSRLMDDINYSTLALCSFNPESASTEQVKMRSTMKGRTFYNFSNYHKEYMPHARHMLYQPENVKGQPGPGQYNHSWANKKRKASYSMRDKLRRFNQVESSTPGPGAYVEGQSARVLSLNVKGTIPRSNRTYLSKFEHSPSPLDYKIVRYLEKKKS